VREAVLLKVAFRGADSPVAEDFKAVEVSPEEASPAAAAFKVAVDKMMAGAAAEVVVVEEVVAVMVAAEAEDFKAVEALALSNPTAPHCQLKTTC